VLELAFARLGRDEFPDGAAGRVWDTGLLEAGEPRVDAAPPRGHELDEQREIVHSRVAFREEIAFQPLQAADGLVEQTTDLGDVPCDGKDLDTQTIANRARDVFRDRGLELRRSYGKCLDLASRALKCSLDCRGSGTTRRRVCDALLRSLECLGIHPRRGYSQRRMDISVLDYELPPELVAQRPLPVRDASRLLVYRRAEREIEHLHVADLPELLSGELVVVNDTRVVPARLALRRASGAAVEVLLLERLDGTGTWEALARPSRRLRPGEHLGAVQLIENRGGGRWVVSVNGTPDGSVPLPPYIHEPLPDPERYQTVYGTVEGSAAAPTAGLHLTPALLDALRPVSVTLHVGLDTFRPIADDIVERHAMHGEQYSVMDSSWARIAAADRVLAVGTTSVRVLETVAATGALSGRTSLYITPGHVFRRVDALMTNFHLPRSTLLALVMAFAGVDVVRELYRVAIAERYRFYSFGDALLVL